MQERCGTALRRTARTRVHAHVESSVGLGVEGKHGVSECTAFYAGPLPAASKEAPSLNERTAYLCCSRMARHTLRAARHGT